MAAGILGMVTLASAACSAAGRPAAGRPGPPNPGTPAPTAAAGTPGPPNPGTPAPTAAAGTPGPATPGPQAPAPAPTPSLGPPASPRLSLPVPGPDAPRVLAAAPAACGTNLASGLASTGGAAQVVTVDAPTARSTSATVELWVRSNGCWVPAAGPWVGRVGAAGVSDHHREGDDSTPAGAFGVGPTMYGLAASPGVSYGYHRLACGDWWDEDPSSPAYNTFQHVACGQAPPFGGGSEALWEQTVAYQRFAVVDYNTSPAVPGAGSGVFIHDDVGGPTAGCVSLPPAELDTLLRWLDPRLSPLVVIGTDAEIRHF